MRKRRGVCRFFWGDPKERYHLENPGVDWGGGGNIKMDLQEVGKRVEGRGMDWTDLEMNLRVP
jgi:hypothetical protein